MDSPQGEKLLKLSRLFVAVLGGAYLPHISRLCGTAASLAMDKR